MLSHWASPNVAFVRIRIDLWSHNFDSSRQSAGHQPSWRSGRERPTRWGRPTTASGTNFAVFSEAADKVELCLFDADGAETRLDAARGRRIRLARLHPQHRARPALRLPGARPVRPGRGHRCNPNKLLLDPYAKAIDGTFDWNQSLFGYNFGDPDSRNDDDSAASMPKCGGHQPVLRLGRRPAARPRIRRHRHLRGARQGAHPDAPRHPRADPRHLRRRRAPGDHRASEDVGRQRDRADAGAPLRQRLDADRQGPVELLGLQHHRLPRAGFQVQLQPQPGRAGAGVQGDGPRAARGGHRGDPRRGLQPHRRGQPPRADAVHARHRQRAPTTGWSTTTSGTTWTTPAPATASTSAIRTRCS